MKRNPDSAQTIPCSECGLGKMHPARVTYFTWLEDELISVPDFPAWVCDMCGRREYDLQAMRQLSRILSPASSLRPGQKPPAPPVKTEKKARGARPSARD